MTTLYQPDNGYHYNSDTIFLYDFVSKLNLKGYILDLGSGSGILGILLAKNFSKIVLESIEKQEIFHKLTEKNSEINRVSNKNYHLDFLESNFQNRYDFIVSNPPFYSSNVVQTKNSNLNIARYNTHLPIDQFFEKVSKALKSRGYFIFCYDAKQFQDLAIALKKYRLQIERVRFVHSSLAKNASLVMVQTRKNSKSDITFNSPLINFSDEVKDIYIKTDTYSLTANLDGLLDTL